MDRKNFCNGKLAEAAIRIRSKMYLEAVEGPARMLEALLGDSHLSSLVPFVRQCYATPSRYLRRDSSGMAQRILQGDGGEQGDAMMPALFCLALRAAVQEIKDGLPEGSTILAYLDDIYAVCDRADAALPRNIRQNLPY